MVRGLADKLKTLRTQHGYSQKKVADILEISASVLSGYETGERTPSVENLLALANLYHTSTDYLLGLSKVDNHKVVDLSHLTDKQFTALRHLIDTM